MTSDAVQVGGVAVGRIRATILGLGGTGVNLLDLLHGRLPPTCVPVAVDTDLERLQTSACLKKVFLQTSLRWGGAGHDPLHARRAAEQAKSSLLEAVSGSDLIVILGGLGGGTASGAAPVISQFLSSQLSSSILGMFTLPLPQENPIIQDQAAYALAEMKPKLDLLITFPNGYCAPHDGSLDRCNSMLSESLLGLVDLICSPCDVNLDLADLGHCLARGSDGFLLTQSSPAGLEVAVRALLNHPLWLRFNQARARSLMMCILGGDGVTIAQAGTSLEMFANQLPADCLIYWGFDGRPDPKGLRLVCLATAGPANARALDRHRAFCDFRPLLVSNTPTAHVLV